MNSDTILILDFDSASGLGARVEEVLAPVTDGVSIQHECIAACANDEQTGFGNILSRVTPSLVILALPSFAAGGPPESVAAMLRSSAVPTMVAMERGEPKDVLRLLELGAIDFVSPPFSPLSVLPRMWRLLDQAHEREDLRHAMKQKLGLKNLVGESPVFLAEVNRIPLISRSDATVLISGETGTGKELFARAIHYLSSRASKPFVPVNCGAIPTELAENELFGHERGAYTGASSSKAGLVSEANGGTLFLDEIDCLPLMAQVKLLRFIQEKEYRPLGSTRMNRADLRIIAASNSDLRAAVRDGRMRQDLYYRLNVVRFTLPPLRERREDIPLLAQKFLLRYASEIDKRFTGLSEEAMHVLLTYDWPGNVRELEHVIERATVLSEGPVVANGDILLESPIVERECSFREAKARMINQFEKTYISGLLVANEGNITKAAQAARKNRRAFFELMRKHNIQGRSFKAGA
ncbi:MAG TPA: sigma 54-interacting transcriptional regulator [Blastocatellia bacterium]|nr:sigma 54-interacting transcriptional regulator [Blastocatellia bacterium]